MLKYKSKKFVAIITAVAVLAFCLIMPGSANSAAMPELPDQSAALAANELLWQTFTLDAAGMPIAYPEEYGGAFIDGELFYIYLVGLNDELEAKYMEICNDSPVVRFLEADYSANYLQSLYDVVDEYVGEYEITAYGSDFRSNRFNVELNSEPGAEICGLDAAGDTTDACAAQEDRLERELLNPAITFSPGAYANISSTNVYGGEQLIPLDSSGNQLSGNAGSITIAGTYAGYPALLTAGHCFLDHGGTGIAIATSAIHGSSGLSIGSTLYTQFKSDENGDFAIVKISNAALTGTNDVYFDYNRTSSTFLNITSYATSYAVGQGVYLSGNTTNHTTFGYISSINKVVNYGNESFPNNIGGLCSVSHTSADKTAKHGDSGGAAFNAASGGYKILGTISGFEHSTSSDAETYETFFSPITIARSAGFEPLLN